MIEQEVQKCVFMNDYKTKNYYKYFCVLCFSLFIGCLVFQMHVSNSTALKGKDFQELFSIKETLQKEIAYLKFEESTLSSLTYVEQQAYEKGFIEMQDSLLSIQDPALASR